MPTNFPNGVRSYGVPLPSGEIPATMGNIFHVDSGHAQASDTNSGKDPSKPCATIDGCVAKMTANNGDIMLVAAGHAETVSAAAGLDLDVAGIHILGLGHGSDRPTITLDTIDSADIDVDAANVKLENVIISANFADIVAAVDVNAVGFSMINCKFQATAIDMNFLKCILTGTANQSDDMLIQNTEFIAIDAANTHAIDWPAAQDNNKVIGCMFQGDWGTFCLGGVGVITLCTIADNVIRNEATTTDGCIDLPATATGAVLRNLCGGAAAQANGVTAGDCLIAENYYCVLTEDLSAILDPIAT